jgi:adenylylsulfate kinase-like enzyme
MKQKLIIISGSPCVGKTTVADELYQEYDNSAYLDSDWVWHVNPFSVEDPRLRSGDKNVSFVLSNYLELGFNFVFCSSMVFTDKDIRENIIKGITAKKFRHNWNNINVYRKNIIRKT